jgi:hypothetical protein
MPSVKLFRRIGLKTAHVLTLVQLNRLLEVQGSNPRLSTPNLPLQAPKTQLSGFFRISRHA